MCHLEEELVFLLELILEIFFLHHHVGVEEARVLVPKKNVKSFNQ
jgi:hypothetical protein